MIDDKDASYLAADFGVASAPSLTDRQKAAYGGLETPLPVLFTDVNAPGAPEEPVVEMDAGFPVLDEGYLDGQLVAAKQLSGKSEQAQQAHAARVNKTAKVYTLDLGMK